MMDPAVFPFFFLCHTSCYFLQIKEGWDAHSDVV